MNSITIPLLHFLSFESVLFILNSDTFTLNNATKITWHHYLRQWKFALCKTWHHYLYEHVLLRGTTQGPKALSLSLAKKNRGLPDSVGETNSAIRNLAARPHMGTMLADPEAAKLADGRRLRLYVHASTNQALWKQYYQLTTLRYMFFENS